MTRRSVTIVLLAASVVAVTLTGAAPPPPPTPGPTPLFTGFDIAVVGIGTTGPNGEPHDNTPIFTFQNKGRRTINRTLGFTYKSNGGVILHSAIHFSLMPGAKHVWTGGATDRGFAPYGATLEVTVDYENEFREDNENNNTMTKTLVDPRKKVKFPRP